MLRVTEQMLSDKIRQSYKLDEENAANKAKEVLRDCPPLLMKNVFEWVSGSELSDVFIGRYSLPMILSIWNSSDFLRALAVMEELQNGETDKAERKIWQMRR